MEQLKYNLVDAYERELNDWWYEIPPAIDRFHNVVCPLVLGGAKAFLKVEEMLEGNTALTFEIDLED